MSIVKDNASGIWKVDIRIGKLKKRYRKNFKTKLECLEYVDFLKQRNEENRPWKGEKLRSKKTEGTDSTLVRWQRL